MIKDFIKNTFPAIKITLALLVLCGLVFPLSLTAVSSILFPYQAGGSVIVVNGKAIGSEHVGQEFTRDYFMFSRPSAYHYNVYTLDSEGNQVYSDGSRFAGLSSGSNNYAPSNPRLKERISADLDRLLKAHPYITRRDVPADLITASGSGLDPHISPAAAAIQVKRIARASGLNEEEIRRIISENTQGKLLGVFGDETVNVLKVNISIAQKMGLI